MKKLLIGITALVLIATAESLVSVPIPDLHLQDIGKKSNGATAGAQHDEPPDHAPVAPLSVRSAGKIIQNGMHAATRTIKDLVQ